MTTKLLPLLLLASGIAAQSAITSPAGLLNTEGSSSHDYILWRYDEMTYQQLDETSVGQGPLAFQRIAWRRDGVAAANTAYTARTMDVEIVLATAVKPGTISTVYADNYVGTPVTAFARRSVNLPDWTQPPAAAPAPFDLVLQLDSPWVYTGLNPYLYEVRTWNNTSAANYGNDFQSTTGTTGSTNSGTIVGTGCVSTGQTTAMALTASIFNNTQKFRFTYGVLRAPATQPVVLFIAAANSNLTIPGLCTTLIAQPTLQVPLGVSTAAGTISNFIVDNIRYSAPAIGATLFSQAVALDTGRAANELPVSLSNGRSNVFPADPVLNPVTRVYGYRISPTSVRAPSSWTGGIVTRFD
jgi:hypothetical protein